MNAELPEDVRKQIAEAIRDGVYHSAQVDSVVIHGAIESIMQIIETQSKHWQGELESWKGTARELAKELRRLTEETADLKAEVEKWKERFNHPGVIEHRADMAKEIAELREALKPLGDLAKECLYNSDLNKDQIVYAYNKATIKMSDLRIVEKLLNSGTESQKG